MSNTPPVWPPQPGVPSPFKQPPRQNNTVLIAALCILALLIIAGLVWFLSPGLLHHSIPIPHS